MCSFPSRCYVLLTILCASFVPSLSLAHPPLPHAIGCPGQSHPPLWDLESTLLGRELKLQLSGVGVWGWVWRGLLDGKEKELPSKWRAKLVSFPEEIKKANECLQDEDAEAFSHVGPIFWEPLSLPRNFPNLAGSIPRSRKIWEEFSCIVYLSAPKSRDSLRLRRRFLPLPEKSRDFLRPQDARFPLRRKSLANRDFFCDENG